MSMNSRTAAFSLYRSLLRETGRLPHEYLRLFFRTKFRDDIASDLQLPAANAVLSASKLKRLRKELARLKAANAGDGKAFDAVLDFAYGRRGKLKWELLEPYLTTNDAEKPPPIIPGVERSRPPGYPPELTALLTSAPSRRTKSLKPSHILNPPALPLRADPDSTEAKLLGPFSKRREVNIRKRYFGIETRKILPPIETSVRYLDASGDVQEDNSVKQISKLGLQAGGFQGTKLLDNLRDMSGFAIRSRSLTRRERKQLMGQINLDPEQNEDLKPGTKLALPTRFLRRRHQSLLGRLPILARVFRDAGENSDTTAKTPVKFDVVMDKGAIHHTLRHGSARLVDTDDINMAWLIRAQEEDKQIMKKGREKE